MNNSLNFPNTTYNILGQTVRVSADVPQVLSAIQQLMRSFPQVDGSSLPGLQITFAALDDNTVNVYRNGEHIGCSAEPWYLFRLMEWQLDIFLAESVTDLVLLHAGVVAKNGNGLILPAESGSGKSSLTLALSLAGFSYLSDELAVISPATGKLLPFPKSLSLKRRSIFPSLKKSLPWIGPLTPPPADVKPVWYLHPHDAGLQLAESAMPQRVIFPQYRKNSTATLEPLSSAQAMHLLLENSVNFERFGPRGLSVLANLAKQAECYTLQFGRLPETVWLLNQLFSG